MLDRNVVVAKLFGLVAGGEQHPVGASRKRRLLLGGVRSGHARQGGERRVDLRAERARVDTGLLEERGHDALVLAQESGQDMLGLDAGIAFPQGPFVCGVERLSDALGHLLDVHICHRTTALRGHFVAPRAAPGRPGARPGPGQAGRLVVRPQPLAHAEPVIAGSPR